MEVPVAGLNHSAWGTRAGRRHSLVVMISVTPVAAITEDDHWAIAVEPVVSTISLRSIQTRVIGVSRIVIGSRGRRGISRRGHPGNPAQIILFGYNRERLR